MPSCIATPLHTVHGAECNVLYHNGCFLCAHTRPAISPAELCTFSRLYVLFYFTYRVLGCLFTSSLSSRFAFSRTLPSHSAHHHTHLKLEIALSYCGSPPDLSATAGLGMTIRMFMSSRRSKSGAGGGGAAITRKVSTLHIGCARASLSHLLRQAYTAASPNYEEGLELIFLCADVLTIGSEATILTVYSPGATCSNNIGASTPIDGTSYIARRRIRVYSGMTLSTEAVWCRLLLWISSLITPRGIKTRK